MAGTTTRLALPFPELTDAADIEQAVKPLTTLLDTIMLAYAKGTHAARPTAAAGNGRLYYETDTGTTYFSDGTTWQRIDLNALNRIIALEATTTAMTGDVNWSAAATRAGSLLCDGASYLRATYPALFTALGGAASPWGLPDGTHFNVPDLRGRAPVGAGTGAGLTARALAATGGEETHLLTTAEAAQKALSTGDESATHLHSVLGSTGAAGGANLPIIAGGRANDFNSVTDTENNVHHHDIPGSSAASPHQNMQPWVALNAFIKT